MVRAALASALLLIPVALSAQTVSVRGGLSIATVGGDDVQGADSRTRMTAGLAVTVPLLGNRGIQVGAFYVQKGWRVTEPGSDATISLDYVEVPLVFRFDIPWQGAITPHVLVGPAVSLKANCQVEVSQGDITVAFDCSDGSADPKAIDVGAIGGVGVDFATSGPVSITLDVLYNLGLRSFESAGESRNRAWSLLAGLGLAIG